MRGSVVISQGGMKHTVDVHAFLKDFHSASHVSIPYGAGGPMGPQTVNSGCNAH